MMMRLRVMVSRLGLNRSSIVRRMVQIGHPRLRELDAKRKRNPLMRAALAPFARWMDRGTIAIPAGRAGGLRIAKAYLPLTHAHLGSIAYGDLESSVQEAMRRHLGEGDVFFDIGANLGFFSLLGARYVGLEGRVYAFEPAPDNVTAIRQNAWVNGMYNIQVIQAAVSDAGGRGQLQVVEDQSWSKLAEYGEHPLTEQVLEVDLVSVDEVVESGKAPPPRLVKIDVEGAELAVIEGMRRTMEAHRPAIVCELHDTHADFARRLDELGYDVTNLEGPEPVDAAGASAHALALPR
jgi:FkbM family methyltransferase